MNNAGRMGRPTDLDESIESKVCEALRDGNTWKQAAQYAGVSERTVMSWKEKGKMGTEPYAHFLQQTRAAEAEVEGKMVRIVTTSAATDWKAASWWLERRRWKQWWISRPSLGAKKDPASMTDDELKDVLVAELAKWAHGDDAFVDKVIARLRK